MSDSQTGASPQSLEAEFLTIEAAQTAVTIVAIGAIVAVQGAAVTAAAGPQDQLTAVQKLPAKPANPAPGHTPDPPPYPH